MLDDPRGRIEKPWCEFEDAQLRDMWMAGLTASAIGRVMARSRNSIIGRSRRIGLERRPSPIRPRTLLPSGEKLMLKHPPAPWSVTSDPYVWRLLCRLLIDDDAGSA